MIDWIYELVYGEKDKEIKRLRSTILLNQSLFVDNLEVIDNQEVEIKALKNTLEIFQEEKQDDILEYFWTHKIKPNKTIMYPARNGNAMNVIRFLNQENNLVPTSFGSNDDKANDILKLVINTIEYTSDAKENWQWANETKEMRKGDCEDGAIYMANIMLRAGIPSWRIRLNAGDVRGAGHAYVTYLRELDNNWYVLDWCYWPRESINFKKKWKNAQKYFGIWWSLDSENGYKKAVLDK